MRPAIIRALVVLMLAAVAAACGGHAGNPAEPSPAVAAGATITGVVVAPAPVGGGAVRAGAAETAPGLTVSVVGTGLSAIVDGNGRFALDGVPAGDRELLFTGAGVNARLAVTGITDGEQISLQVTVAGTSATLNGEQRAGAGKVEIEGIIAADPDESANTLIVNNVTIVVPAGTEIRHGDTAILFSALRAGDRVHVRGTEAGDHLVADLVLLQNPVTPPEAPPDPPTPPQTVELEGRIAAVNPGGSSRTLLVETTPVSVPAGTEIRHGDTAIDFGALQVGDRVHVRGVMEGDVLVAGLVLLQSDNATVPVNVKGAVSAVDAGFSCPAIRFVVEGWVIETTGATDFKKGSCADVVVGTEVHVTGAVQPSGRVLATWVQIGK